MFWVLVAGSLVLGTLEVLAARSNWRWSCANKTNRAWSLAHRFQLLIAMPLAYASRYAEYSVSGNGGERYKMVGFPIIAAAFDAAGADYVGPLTLPAFIVNALLWSMLPALVLWLWAKRVSKNA